MNKSKNIPNVQNVQSTQSLLNAPITTTIEEMQSEADRRVGEVFKTMLVFTSLMVICPISSYFLSKAYIFESNHQTIKY